MEVDFRKFWWKEEIEDLKVIKKLNVKLIINRRLYWSRLSLRLRQERFILSWLRFVI